VAAPAYRSAGLPTLNTTTTSVTITKPAGTVSGDLLIACVTNGSANAAPSSVPSSWNLLVGQGGTTWWGGIYYLVAGGSEPADYTWSGFTDSCTGVMIAVSGADPASPFDGFTAAPNVGTATPGSASITTTVADTLIVGACAEDDNNGLSTWACATDPTTLTERADFGSSGGADTGAGIATGTKATAGATGAFSLAISAARDSSAFLFAVKAPSAGGGVAVGQAAETDTANAVTPSHLVAVGQAESTETAQAIAPSSSVAVAQAATTETAGVVTPSTVVHVGQATETDTANAIGAGSPITVAVGQATETSTAAAITPSSLVTVTQAVEQDTALGVTPSSSVAVGQAAETSTAGVITPGHLVTVSQAEELDTAGAVAPSKRVTVGQAAEADTAGAIDSGQTDEQDITLNVGPPATAWTVSRPERGWAAGVTTSWSAGSPTL
jgi:hypothetical protein